MVLLDGGRHRSGYPKAVAAHLHVLFRAVLVQHGGVHGAAVLVAELEDMTYFDTAGDLQRAPAPRTDVAFHGVAQVHAFRLRQVASPIGVDVMLVAPVRPADEIRPMGRGVIHRK